MNREFEKTIYDNMRLGKLAVDYSTEVEDIDQSADRENDFGISMSDVDANVMTVKKTFRVLDKDNHFHDNAKNKTRDMFAKDIAKLIDSNLIDEIVKEASYVKTIDNLTKDDIEKAIEYVDDISGILVNSILAKKIIAIDSFNMVEQGEYPIGVIGTWGEKEIPIIVCDTKTYNPAEKQLLIIVVKEKSLGYILADAKCTQDRNPKECLTDYNFTTCYSAKILDGDNAILRVSI